jgi:hypothetical protein
MLKVDLRSGANEADGTLRIGGDPAHIAEYYAIRVLPAFSATMCQ